MTDTSGKEDNAPVGNFDSDRKIYSICMSHYNDPPQMVEACLESIVRQIDARFEIIVVDNFSNNGSERILRRYAQQGTIRLVLCKSSRGKARQIAFSLAAGRYILSNMDFDDLFNPCINDFLELYHHTYEGKMVRIKRSDGLHTSITVAPSALLRQIGGWRDVQYFEDTDLWNRAEKIGMFEVIPSFPILKNRGNSLERRGLAGRLAFRYVADRDKIRLNLPRGHKWFDSFQYGISWLSARILGEPKYVSLDDASLTIFNQASGSEDDPECRRSTNGRAFD